jgi:hypothetical protein
MHEAGSSPRRRLWRTAELGRWCACARSGRGLVYTVVGGWFRACEVTPMTGARAVWATMLGDVRLPRRPMARGWRCAGECGLATWHHPSGRGRHAQEHTGAVQGPLDIPTPRRARPTRVRRRSDVAAHDVALGTRSGVREPNQFAESIFIFDFLHFLKLKCTLHQIAKLKIIYSSTTSAKAVRGFDH